MIKKISLLITLIFFALIATYHNMIIRTYRDYQSLKLSKSRAEIYRLKGKKNFKRDTIWNYSLAAIDFCSRLIIRISL